MVDEYCWVAIKYGWNKNIVTRIKLQVQYLTKIYMDLTNRCFNFGGFKN